MRRQFFYLCTILALAPTGSMTATLQPESVLGVRTDIAQQVEPKKKEITAIISRSLENETISLTASFPDDMAGIKVALYSILGKQIDVDPTISVTKGDHTFVFRTSGLPNGPYLVVLEAGNQRITKKIMLSR